MDALSHPVMWQAYLKLKEAERVGALDSDDACVSLLAGTYIEWFHWKLMLRDAQWLKRLELASLVEILAAISAVTGAGATHSEDEWVQPACARDLVSQSQASDLLREAISGGLLRETARRQWQWRHRIVREYLADVAREDRGKSCDQ